MNAATDILCVRLRSGSLVRLEVIALDPPVSEMSEDVYTEPRAPRYAEVIEAGELLAAGRGEPWADQVYLKPEGGQA